MTFKEKMDRWIAPLKWRVEGMIAKAIVQAVSESSQLQVLKLTVGSETHDGVESIQPYGFTSCPPVGSQAVVVFIAGRRDNPLVVACDDGRVRVKCQPGDPAMYNNSGAIVRLQPGGKVAIGNDNTELLDLLHRLMTAVETGIVSPGGGPLDTVAAITALKVELAGLKGDL
jgi:phage baseplate assembly protein V